MIRALAALVVTGCTVAPLDYSLLGCPCPEPEYTCACLDGPDERCVPANEEVACVSDMDAGVAAPTCDGLFVITGLDRAWNTENVIAIQWSVVTREPDLFDRYTVELTPEAGGETIVVDRLTNPELGEYMLDRSNIVVERTWLRNLTPSTVYDVRLTAFDRNGGECQLDGNFSTRAPEQNGEWVFFRDAARNHVPQGDCASIQPGEGDPYVQLRAQCEQLPDESEPTSYCDTREPFEAVDSCFVNLLIFPEAMPITDEFRRLFPQAIVEFRLRAEGEGNVSSDWSINLIRTVRQQRVFDANPSPETDQAWGVLGFTVPLNQGFQTFQVPLAQYTNTVTGDAISVDDLDVFEWFLVGGTWPEGMRLDVDDVRIRW